MFSPLTLTEVNLTGRGNSIIVRSTVTDYSLFTLHSPFDTNLSLPPPSIPPLTEVNLTGEGRLTGRGTKSVILNLFQDLSFRKAYLTLPLSYLGEGIVSLCAAL